MRRAFSIAFVALLAAAPPASAQSIFAAGGRAVPVAPVDARARALGGIGIGLLNQNLSLVNPAGVAGIRLRGITAAWQTAARSIEFEGAEEDVGSNRFPLLRIVYPVGSRLVLSAGYGSFLDQSAAVASEGTEVIGTDTLAVRDVLDVDGGIAQLQLGAAYALTPTLAVGIAGGLYAGEIDRELSRSFTNTGLADLRIRSEWSERAPFASAGIRWDPAPVARLGASVTWAGELDGDADDVERSAGGITIRSEGEDFSVDLPLQVAAGASALLAPRLLATVAGRWAGWSSAERGFGPDDLAAADLPDDTWEFGAGLEWEGLTVANRTVPLRLGYHRGQFPYKVQGETPTEWAAALGAGARLATSELGPLAVVDLALERGGRDGGDLSEDFWRFTFSIALFGR